jgi:hypothetical protein
MPIELTFQACGAPLTPSREHILAAIEESRAAGKLRKGR